MNNERITELLDKYWACETSISEEMELQEFFRSGNVPEELQPYVTLFTYRRNLQALKPGDGFEERLVGSIRKAERQNRYITIRIFEPLLRIAASVLLVTGIGISVYLFSRQNSQVFAETYNDPEAAMQQATLALDKLSRAIQATEEASLKSLEQLDNLELDWSEIDSLSTEIVPIDPDFNKDVKPGRL